MSNLKRDSQMVPSFEVPGVNSRGMHLIYLGVSMSVRNQSLNSEVQLNLDLTAEEMNQDTDGTDYTDESDELINLLAEILEEEFCIKPDDCLEVMEDRFIYNLDSEKDIVAREKYEFEQLNEGVPEVEKLDELESVAQAYFSHPNYYPIQEDDQEEAWVTCFFQQYKGASFDSNGHLKENWRTTGKKMIVKFEDLYQPEKVIAQAEAGGILVGEVIRIVVYGPALESLIGSKLYRPKEAKEFVPLIEGDNRILLATPSIEDCEYEESIYDWINQEIQDGIPYGIQPNVSRSTLGHWELTAARIDELQEEELERKNLLRFSKKETIFVKKQNEFADRYKEAKQFIKGINSGELTVKALYSLQAKVVEDVLYLAEKCNERIDNTAIYIQVRSLASKKKVSQLRKQIPRHWA